MVVHNNKQTAESIITFGKQYARWLQVHQEGIINVLLQYETYEVASDEFNRTIDLLSSLDENKQYFTGMIGNVTAFLPRNQPLYALACFAIVPSFQSNQVYVKKPEVMGTFFDELVESIQLKHFFPGIKCISMERKQFVRQRAKDPLNQVVIYTGGSQNGNSVRKQFPKSTLFILNGAAHNPIVISKDADIELAVEGILRTSIYNQGEDCASPNSVLVHTSVHAQVVAGVTEALTSIGIGSYSDRYNRIGPLTKQNDIFPIQDFLYKERRYIHSETPGVIRTRDGIIEPTVIVKPLTQGANYSELYAPIIFVQEYQMDEDLELYFDTKRYKDNAGYITVYGTSRYVSRLLSGGDDRVGEIIHTSSTLVHNTNLHAPGIERGVKPYGGYGRNASYVSHNDIITPKPTLPQRDIYEHLIEVSCECA